MFSRGLDIPHILQINAIIIAGILILLTVSSFRDPIPFLTTEHGIRTVNQLIATTLIPFTLSSIFALVISYEDLQEKKLQVFGTLTFFGMFAGFVYLVLLVAIVAFL